MFGCTAVYVGDKIVFILRQKGNPIPDDGVWLATTAEHHESLQKDFPTMRSIELFGPGPTGWQVLPADSDDFEDNVLKACAFILQSDPRIGKIPKSRWKKKGTSKKKKAAAQGKGSVKSKPATKKKATAKAQAKSQKPTTKRK
jgi:hypothetical protein